MTGGGTVHGDMCLPILILGLLKALLPFKGLSGNLHSRGLIGFMNSSTGGPRDLTEIPSIQRHSMPSKIVEDAFFQSKNKHFYFPTVWPSGESDAPVSY